MIMRRKKNRPGIYVPPIKSRSTARAPHPHGGKPNPKGLTLPAHVRINPRTGKTQIFVTPQVAEKLRGTKGIRLARNPYNSDFGQQAWEAGKRWASQAGDSGVANAHVVRYGFIKWWNGLSPSTTKGIKKSAAEKDFRQGYKIGKR